MFIIDSTDDTETFGNKSGRDKHSNNVVQPIR